MQDRCMDCFVKIEKTSAKGRRPKRCSRCRQVNADKWRKIHKEKLNHGNDN